MIMLAFITGAMLGACLAVLVYGCMVAATENTRLNIATDAIRRVRHYAFSTQDGLNDVLVKVQIETTQTLKELEK